MGYKVALESPFLLIHEVARKFGDIMVIRMLGSDLVFLSG